MLGILCKKNTKINIEKIFVEMVDMLIKLFHIKSVEFRKLVNLKLYENELINAIKQEFPQSEVVIYKDYFKLIFTNKLEAQIGIVKKIGVIIGVECVLINEKEIA